GALAAARGFARGGGGAIRGGARDAGERRAHHAHVEAAPRDLDGVCLLDLVALALALVRRRRGGRLEREGLQPLLVLEQVPAGLALRPLLARQQRAMERDQRLQPLDLVFVERAQHSPRRLLAVD